MNKLHGPYFVEESAFGVGEQAEQRERLTKAASTVGEFAELLAELGISSVLCWWGLDNSDLSKEWHYSMAAMAVPNVDDEIFERLKKARTNDVSRGIGCDTPPWGNR